MSRPITQKRKAYLQSIGYSVAKVGDDLCCYVPDSSDPGNEYLDWGSDDDFDSENSGWRALDRHAKKKVLHLVVVLTPSGKFYGVFPFTNEQARRFDPRRVAMGVADRIDEDRSADGFYYAFVNHFESGKMLSPDMHRVDSRWVRIDHYNLGRVFATVMDESFDPHACVDAEGKAA